MAARFMVSVDRLTEEAVRCKEQAYNLEILLRQIDETINSLLSSFDGDAFNNLAERFNEDKDKAYDIVSVLENLYTEIHEIQKAYTLAENSILTDLKLE